jgi:hypothetical protein
LREEYNQCGQSSLHRIGGLVVKLAVANRSMNSFTSIDSAIPGFDSRPMHATDLPTQEAILLLFGLLCETPELIMDVVNAPAEERAVCCLQ